MDVCVFKIEGSIIGFSVEIGIFDVDVYGLGGKLNMFKMKVFKFFVLGLKGEGISFDVVLFIGEVIFFGVFGDVSLFEIVIGGFEGKMKGVKVKIFEMIIQKFKIFMQDVDLSLGFCKLKGNMKIFVFEVKGDVKGFQMVVKGFRVDIEILNLEGILIGFKISSFFGKIGVCRIFMVDVDLNVVVFKGKGGVDVIFFNVEGKVKGFEVDVKGFKMDISVLDVEVYGLEWNLKMFKFSVLGVKGEGLDVNVILFEGDISILGFKVNVEVLNVNMEGLGGKFKGFDINFFEVSVKILKIFMFDVDLYIKGLKVKGEYEVILLKFEGELKGFKVDIDIL